MVKLFKKLNLTFSSLHYFINKLVGFETREDFK